MTLGRLELLRYVRTWRLPALLGVHVLVGLGSPILVRYEEGILEMQPGVVVNRPPPTAVDGVLGFIDTWSQTGLLVVVIAAATAFCVDQYPGAAALLRTSLPMRSILLRRFTVSWAMAATAFLVAWGCMLYEVEVLFGGLHWRRAFETLCMSAIYLLFAVAVAALAAGLTRSRGGAVGGALLVLVLLSALESVRVLAPWLPTSLLAEQRRVLAAGFTADQGKAIAVALAAGVTLVVIAIQRMGSREFRARGEEA